MKNKVGIKSLPKQPSDEIKEELETVYITTSGSKYLKKMDALCAQSQIQQARESREKRRKVIMSMVDILLKVLKENNWGVFYKSEPMQTLTIQGDTPLLRVNEVDDDSLESAVLGIIEGLTPKELVNCVKEEIKEEIEDKQVQSPPDSTQTSS
jgi:hypothetical protein